MAVIDIARTNVATGQPDDTVAEVVRRLHEDEVSGLVIVEDGQPIDLVTHEDLTPVILEADFDAEATAVGDLQSQDLVTVPAEKGVYNLLNLFSEKGVRRAPVVDEDGDLEGIISLSDVVVLLGMELQQVANTIRGSSPAYERAGPALYERE